jgi:hypothetical protein
VSRLGNAAAVAARVSRCAADTPARILDAAALHTGCSGPANNPPAAKIGNTAACLAYVSGVADNALAAGIDALAAIACISGLAHNPLAQGRIRNAAAAGAYEIGITNNPLASRLDALASIAYLTLRAYNTLADHEAGAVGIAHARGAVGAVYRITDALDALLAGRARDAGAGVLRPGTIKETPAESQHNNHDNNPA